MSTKDAAKVNRLNAPNLNTLPHDVVTKLSEKLSELMGEDVGGELDRSMNERGELLNEEGLPIIDITEAVELSTNQNDDTEYAGLVEESPLPPIHSLSEEDRKQLRQERNRLLDQLEEEENTQLRREEQADAEARQEILRKRKEAAAQEKETLKKTKEMHKKMGRLLLQNLAKEREEEEKAQVAEVISDDERRSTRTDKNKKTVSFADDVIEEHIKEPQELVNWGDITPARLRSPGAPSVRPPSHNLPMKMTVVERTPTAPPNIPTRNDVDSDDESDPEDDDEGSDPALDLEEDEYDAEFAHHQREIALQYHEKRRKIGETALAALTAHSHDDNGEVQLDLLETPSHESVKPSISRFKATRLASSYAAISPSTSMDASIVPASTARTIQKAVRTGKLDADGQLVGGDADSASEDETEGMQELLELLKKGELYNIGPDGNYLHTPSLEKPPSDSKETSLPSATSKAIYDDLPPLARPKTSKFKLSRTPRQSTSSSSNMTSQGDSLADTSLPKLPSTMNSSVVERNTPISSQQSLHGSLKKVTPVATSVVERPSTSASPAVKPDLSKPSHPAASNPSGRQAQIPPSATFPSMIVESPSFPASPAFRASGSSTTSTSIVDSPSFPPSRIPETRSRPTGPPTVMSSAVREVDATASLPRASRPTQAAKVSRFMAERT
ncbi:hypothetical protein H0H93_010665 [Arthromyces matolae]|nr:hypothetical protein H0H93_010665 [Arthromyces matolae]